MTLARLAWRLLAGAVPMAGPLLTAGCASAPQALPSGFEFATLITPTGEKLFEFNYPLYRHSPEDGRTGSYYTAADAVRLLEGELQRSRYCREGYLLLGRQAGPSARRLRGECRERATATDRAAYPDTLRDW